MRNNGGLRAIVYSPICSLAAKCQSTRFVHATALVGIGKNRLISRRLRRTRNLPRLFISEGAIEENGEI